MSTFISRKTINKEGLSKVSNYNSKKSNNSKKSKKSILKLPSPAEFRNTLMFDDMVYDYRQKDKNISHDKITDNDIIEYINKLNDFQKNYLIKENKEIKEYSKLKNKINFQPITVEILRKKYWNQDTQKWNTIKNYYANGDYPNNKKIGPEMIDNVQDRNNREKVFYNEFTPNGDLIETDMKTLKDKKYKKWLQSDKLGPYKYKNYNYLNKRKFFYLGGHTRYRGDNTVYKDGMQICEGNYVSGNCIDGPGWIETDNKMYI